MQDSNQSRLISYRVKLLISLGFSLLAVSLSAALL